MPPKRDDGVAASAHARRSSAAAGNVRFDALVQASRLNHLTLVEAWIPTRRPGEAHSAANPTSSRSRSTLGPLVAARDVARLYALLK